MSKENDFHKIIESQNKEEKLKAWKKIEARDCSESDNVESQGNVLALSKNKQFYLKILIPVFVVISAISILLLCIFLIKKPDSISIRYCVNSDYYYVEADTSIEQYALNNGKDLLYFDWYKECEYYVDHHFKLKDTNEIICLREELVDANNVYVEQYVTDKNTKLDLLEYRVNLCSQTTTVKNVQIHWGYDSVSGAVAYFEYEGYNYYILVEDASNSQYVLDLIETLIK